MEDQTFYIFRHGETLATQTNTSYEDQIKTAHILDKGKDAIKRMGLFLKDVKNAYGVTSEFLRCIETVEIIKQQTGIDFVTDKRLDEFYEETLEQFEANVKNFLQDISLKSERNILICSHGAVISALVDLLTKEKIEEADLYNYPIPGMLLVVKKRAISEINFNVTF